MQICGTALFEAVPHRENAMSRSFAYAVAVLALLWSTGLATAQQSGTVVEAQAMFDRGVAALKADKAKALSERFL